MKNEDKGVKENEDAPKNNILKEVLFLENKNESNCRGQSQNNK